MPKGAFCYENARYCHTIPRVIQNQSCLSVDDDDDDDDLEPGRVVSPFAVRRPLL